jgi:hypothetical protein
VSWFFFPPNVGIKSVVVYYLHRMYIFVRDSMSNNMCDIGMYYDGSMIYPVSVLVNFCSAVKFLCSIFLVSCVWGCCKPIQVSAVFK